MWLKPEPAERVATNAASTVRSRVHVGLARRGIYGRDVMAGFTACGGNPEEGTVWVVRHTIGEQFRAGYGKAGLPRAGVCCAGAA